MSKIKKTKKVWFDLFFSLLFKTGDLGQRIFGSFCITVPYDVNVDYDYIIKYVFIHQKDFFKSDLTDINLKADRISGISRIEFKHKDAEVAVSIMNIH